MIAFYICLALVGVYLIAQKYRAMRNSDALLERADNFCGREDVDDHLKVMIYDVVREAIYWRVPMRATYNYFRFGRKYKKEDVDAAFEECFGKEQSEEFEGIIKDAMYLNFMMAPFTWILCSVIILSTIAILSFFKPNGGSFDGMGKVWESSWIKAVR